MAEIFRDPEALQDHAQAAVKVGNNCQLKLWVQLRENVNHLGLQFPHTGFGEVLVGHFEKIISIQFADFGRGFSQHMISQFAPPIFVVVFAWAIDCLARRHFRPGGVEGGIQFFCVQIQTDFFPDERVMIAYRFR